MYKIFYNSKILTITENKNALTDKKYIFQDNSSKNKKELKEWLNFFENSEFTLFYILSTSEKKTLKKIKDIYNVEKAAGGIVINNNKQILSIYRYNKWDLPKGKKGKNESYKETALREVKEECGLSQLSIEGKIGKTYHIYTKNNKKILKITKWFLMTTDSNEIPKPQLSEGITDVKWFNINQLNIILCNTYESLKEIYNNELIIDLLR